MIELVKGRDLTEARSSLDDLARRGTIALRGLTEASERFDAVEVVDEEAMAVAITEAAMWATVLDDLLVAGAPTYAAYKRDDADAGVLAGLRWARHRGVHQAITVHHTTEGRRFPMRFPVRFYSVLWRPRAELPEPDSRHRDSRLEVAYDAHLAGEQVWVTLRAARFFLERSLGSGGEGLLAGQP